jgi:hypothetical protein
VPVYNNQKHQIIKTMKKRQTRRAYLCAEEINANRNIEGRL